MQPEHLRPAPVRPVSALSVPCQCQQGHAAVGPSVFAEVVNCGTRTSSATRIAEAVARPVATCAPHHDVDLLRQRSQPPAAFGAVQPSSHQPSCYVNATPTRELLLPIRLFSLRFCHIVLQQVHRVAMPPPVHIVLQQVMASGP